MGLITTKQPSLYVPPHRHPLLRVFMPTTALLYMYISAKLWLLQHLSVHPSAHPWILSHIHVQGRVPISHKLSSTFCEETLSCDLKGGVTGWVVCQTPLESCYLRVILDYFFVANRNFMMPVIGWDPNYSDWPVQPQKMVMKDLVRWKAVKPENLATFCSGCFTNKL